MFNRITRRDFTAAALLQSTLCHFVLPSLALLGLLLYYHCTQEDMCHSPVSTGGATVSRVKGLFTMSLDLAAKLRALKVSK